MKKLAFLFVSLSIHLLSYTQENINELTLKDFNGKKITFSEIINANKPTIISFWATWCAPCLQELEAINEVYEEWQKKLNVTLYAVCVDDSRSLSKASALAKGKGWNYHLLFDPNQDLKRLLNIANIPYTLVYVNGKIIYQHTGYSPGSEDVLYTKIKNHIQ
jgi:thiol-disulfide isomerase/thioredoxin